MKHAHEQIHLLLRTAVGAVKEKNQVSRPGFWKDGRGRSASLWSRSRLKSYGLGTKPGKAGTGAGRGVLIRALPGSQGPWGTPVRAWELG